MKNLMLFASLVWLLIVASVFVVLGNLSAGRLPALVETDEPVDLQQQFERLQGAAEHLRALERSFVGTAGDASLLAQRPPPSSSAAPMADSAALHAKPAEARPRVLSLIYVSGGFRRAVIDGAYVAAGSTLPGSARVVRIDATQVEISEAGVRRLLKVDTRANAIGHIAPVGG